MLKRKSHAHRVLLASVVARLPRARPACDVLQLYGHPCFDADDHPWFDADGSLVLCAAQRKAPTLKRACLKDLPRNLILHLKRCVSCLCIALCSRRAEFVCFRNLAGCCFAWRVVVRAAGPLLPVRNCAAFMLALHSVAAD